MDESSLIERREWVAGASSFPRGNFQAVERAKAEAALNLCDSSCSNDDREQGRAGRMAEEGHENRHARKKDQKKRKRKRDDKDHDDDPASLIKGDRGKIVRAEREAHSRGGLPERRGQTIWAASGSSFGGVLGVPGFSAQDKDLLFIDRAGDLLNLAYLCLQAAHTPVFLRRDPFRLVRGMTPGGAFSSKNDGDSIRVKVPRYYQGKFTQLESSKSFKRIRLREDLGKKGHAAVEDSCPGDKIWWRKIKNRSQAASESMDSEVIELSGSEALLDKGESFDEFVLRKTGELNKATRVRPNSLEAWVELASFQVEAASCMGGKRGLGMSGAQEKRVVILQQALKFIPGNERLLSDLLEASGDLLDAESLCGRWQNVLDKRRGSSTLWAKYIAYRLSLFPLFKVGRMLVIYSDALHDLSVELGKRRKARVDLSEIRAREERLVDLALDLVRFELEAGFTERSIARIQATIEFHCFNPNTARKGQSQLPPVGVQLRQFDLFFESGSPMIGEKGGRGWADWFEHSNKDLMMARPLGEEADASYEVKEPEAGSWTGWEDVKPEASIVNEPGLEVHPGSKGSEENEEKPNDSESESVSDEGTSDDGDVRASDDDEDDEALLARLGVKLDEDLEAMQRRGVEPKVLNLLSPRS